MVKMSWFLIYIYHIYWTIWTAGSVNKVALKLTFKIVFWMQWWYIVLILQYDGIYTVICHCMASEALHLWMGQRNVLCCGHRQTYSQSVWNSYSLPLVLWEPWSHIQQVSVLLNYLFFPSILSLLCWQGTKITLPLVTIKVTTMLHSYFRSKSPEH